MIHETIENSRRSPRIPAQLFWPGLVIALLTMSVVAMTTTMMLAVSDPAFAIVEDYEAKASAWNETSAALHESAKLGWEATIEFDDDVNALNERTVLITLINDDGDPVSNATVQASAFHPARSAHKIILEFTEVQPGVYTARFAPRREGLWDFALTASRGKDQFIDHQQQWLMDFAGR